jgi:hypothetical protein
MLGPKAVLAEGTAAAIEVIVAENPTFPWTSRGSKWRPPLARVHSPADLSQAP